MSKYSLPKLGLWFLKSLIILAVISFLVTYIFFNVLTDRPFSDFLLLIYGFIISCFVLTILFIRLLHPLARVAEKINTLAAGKGSINKHEDFFLNEPGEFYNINKNINILSDDLQLKRTIISQEASELEAVISAVTGGILAVDQYKKVLFFNNEAVNLFEINKDTSSAVIYLSEIIRNPSIVDMYNECLQTSQVIKKTITIHSTFSMEQKIVYEVTVAPLEKDSNRPRGAVALFYNITNMKRTEQMQTDFISNVSHELRTPLTAIQGYVQTLLSDLNVNTQDKTEQFLKVIDRNVKRLVSLLNHFLELSSIENSESLKKETLSTKEITESIIKDLHVKDREIIYNFSATTIQADRHFLKQVLYNLVDNAIKYTLKNCLIEVSWTTNKNNEVVLTVKDHGQGIPLSEQDRMFERFYRADPSRNKIRGAGLGLSIVKQLIAKHGGTINLVSDGMRGSSFICTFPNI